MPKKVAPVSGVTTEKALDKAEQRTVALCKEGGRKLEHYKAVVKDWRDVIEDNINPGTCMSQAQEQTLVQMFEVALDPFDVPSSGYKTLRTLRTHIGDPNLPTKEVARSRNEMIMLANSFRLDCENCLNADCEDRDPSVPPLGQSDVFLT